MAVTKLPGFKPIPAGIDRELAGSLTAIQEALEVRLGRRGRFTRQSHNFTRAYRQRASSCFS
jgi:hypothetical protein